MKAERKQELRTNDLAQQIDSTVSYVKENGARLAAIVLGAAVVVAVFVWYSNHRRSRVDDALDSLYGPSVPDDPSARIRTFQSIIDDNVNADVTLAAWLRIGDEAIRQLTVPDEPLDDATTKPATENWPELARNAFERVESLAGDNLTARGRALFGLAWVAEYRYDFEAARKIYQRVLDDARFAGLPFHDQARYRLDHLKDWSSPIEFPPPPVIGPAEAPTTSPDTTASAPAETPVATTQPAGASAATTQPAADLAPPVPASLPTTTQPAAGVP